MSKKKGGGIWKITKVRNKFLGPGRPLMLGYGFPDFVAFKKANSGDFEVVAVEAKSNGYLDQKEKTMSQWLIDHNIFSKIIIAKKGKKRGEVEYIDFKEKYKVDNTA